MGQIPATGNTLQMTRIRNAYGLTGAVTLRQLGNAASLPAGQVRMSDFHSRTTPNDY